LLLLLLALLLFSLRQLLCFKIRLLRRLLLRLVLLYLSYRAVPCLLLR
jgi:hypothetical protein